MSPEIQAMLSGFNADPSQPLTAPLPAISELKNFLCAELASFKDELERQNDESISLDTHLNRKGTKSSTSIRKK